MKYFLLFSRASEQTVATSAAAAGTGFETGIAIETGAAAAASPRRARALPAWGRVLAAALVLGSSSAAFAVGGEAYWGPEGSDNFADAVAFSAQYRRVDPTNVSAFTTEPGEPQHGNGVDPTAGKTAWWKWTAPVTGWCTVSTEETGYLQDPLLATCFSIYTGDELASLQRVGRAFFVNSVVGNTFSRTSFLAQAGTTYSIAVDGAWPDQGNGSNVVLSISQFVPFNATMSGATTITALAANGGETLPVALTLTSTATGRVTGKVTTPMKTWSFVAVYGIDGTFEINFDLPVAKDQPAGPPLQMLVSAGGMRLSYKGAMVQEALSKQIRPTGSARPTAGLYNLAATNENSPSASVGGHAFVQARVKASGSVSLAYTLADGTALTQGTWLYDTGEGTSFGTSGLVLLYKKKGWLLMKGGVSKIGESGSRASLSFVQHRPADLAKDYYKAGFQERFITAGNLYMPPARGRLPFDFLAATEGDCYYTLEADGEEFPGPDHLREFFTLNTAGRFIRPGSITKLALNLKTGLVTGGLTDPDGVKRKLKGVLFQDTSNNVKILGQATGRLKTLRWKVTPVEP